MSRIGNLYGPDATFLGVPAADPDDRAAGDREAMTQQGRCGGKKGTAMRPQEHAHNGLNHGPERLAAIVAGDDDLTNLEDPHNPSEEALDALIAARALTVLKNVEMKFMPHNE